MTKRRGDYRINILIFTNKYTLNVIIDVTKNLIKPVKWLRNK